VLLVGGAGLIVYLRGRSRIAADGSALSEDEMARIERLIGDGDRRA
jgi:hypothetical protein